MKNIDGLLVTRKSLIREDVVDGVGGVDGDGVDETAEIDEDNDDLGDFISLVQQCGEQRFESENLNKTVNYHPSKARQVLKPGKGKESVTFKVAE